MNLKTDTDLECKSDGVEAEVYYEVEALDGALADKVVVWVSADGVVLNEATGYVNENIKLQFLIPADNPDC